MPAADAEACRSGRPAVDAAFVDAVAERERVTDHDVAAFVDVVQEPHRRARPGQVDPLRADVLRRGRHGLVLGPARRRRSAAARPRTRWSATLKAAALEHRDTAMVGRTHGVHAEPTTFGSKLALWCLQADRDRDRLRAARDGRRRRQAVGRGRHLLQRRPGGRAPRVRGARSPPVPATQVIARDRHAEYLWACAAVGATVELIAIELRHLQRTEVREVEEGFKAGQKGSSAMPHKRNPITAERLTGLARILRGNLRPGWRTWRSGTSGTSPTRRSSG